jgi:hypothetical protein
MNDEVEESPFDDSRREAKRARWALNALVFLSALAGAVFFGYVLHVINPLGGNGKQPVEIPTSAPGAKIGLLRGEADGLSVELRDIDEAPTYREQLSETMRRDLGIEAAGRLYLLRVRHDGEQPVELTAETMTLSDDKARDWRVRWLPEVASAESAGATGKLRLAQSTPRFALAKGESRVLYVFVESAGDTPPSAEDFTLGSLHFSGGRRLELSHAELKVARQ